MSLSAQKLETLLERIQRNRQLARDVRPTTSTMQRAAPVVEAPPGVEEPARFGDVDVEVEVKASVPPPPPSVRPAAPTPLEVAVTKSSFDEAATGEIPAYKSAPPPPPVVTGPAAPVRIAASAPVASGPVARATSASAPVPKRTFGSVIQRSLALRPRR